MNMKMNSIKDAIARWRKLMSTGLCTVNARRRNFYWALSEGAPRTGSPPWQFVLDTLQEARATAEDEEIAFPLLWDGNYWYLDYGECDDR
jgi:hypothetical protein